MALIICTCTQINYFDKKWLLLIKISAHVGIVALIIGLI